MDLVAVGGSDAGISAALRAGEAGRRQGTETAKRVDTYAAALFQQMSVDTRAELDLSHPPQLGSPRDAVHEAARSWVRVSAARPAGRSASAGAAMTTPTVLYVCVQHSARSQMAAALLKARGGERVHVRSAGSARAEQIAADIEARVDALLAELIEDGE